MIQINAVFRRHRNAYAGVGGELMAKAFIGFADRGMNPRHEVRDIGWPLDGSLKDREFVAAQSGDEIGVPDATAQPRRHRLQQFVANVVTKGIVNAFELVNVDVQHSELAAALNPLEFVLKLLAEQYAVRKVGE